ncbi:MATE family efflux transporter [Vaginisenegalia massiliensis]|uniref:MATE family efflux transporter n=1 Tax=Vaginisenegalia massiliensis TaxID=2058294 RepID=UPI000F544F71|nr:MATE family efflux transporter [Vaginisenegalia massiliensis]
MNLIKPKLPKAYFPLLWPLLIEQVFMMIIGNVNVYIYSLYSDQIVASIGIADQVTSVGTMAMGIVSLGSTILFLQNAESSRLSYFQAVARQTMWLNVALAVLISLSTFMFGGYFMEWMQTPNEIRGFAIRYLQIVSFSLLFQGLSTSIGAILRAHGLSKQSMQLSILNTVIVIMGNVLVVFLPIKDLSQRVIVISWMTVLTRLVGTLFSARVLRKQLTNIWQGLGQFKRSDLQVGRKLLALGIPSGMENVSYNFSQTVITAIIASLGTVEVSARIYVQTITALVFTLSVAAGQAGQVMVGNYFRAKRWSELQAFSLENTRLFMGIGVAINLLLAICGTHIMTIFTDNSAIIQLGTHLLWLNVFYDPCRVGNEIMIASLNVLGEVRFPVKMGILMTYIFTVPVCYLVGKVLQLDLTLIWLVFITDEAIRLTLFIRRWISLTKEKGMIR